MYNGKFTTLSLTDKEREDFINTIIMLGFISGSLISEIESAVIRSKQSLKQLLILKDDLNALIYELPALYGLLREVNISPVMVWLVNDFLNLILNNKPQIEMRLLNCKYADDRFKTFSQTYTYKKLLDKVEIKKQNKLFYILKDKFFIKGTRS